MVSNSGHVVEIIFRKPQVNGMDVGPGFRPAKWYGKGLIYELRLGRKASETARNVHTQCTYSIELY